MHKLIASIIGVTACAIISPDLGTSLKIIRRIQSEYAHINTEGFPANHS